MRAHIPVQGATKNRSQQASPSLRAMPREALQSLAEHARTSPATRQIEAFQRMLEAGEAGVPPYLAKPVAQLARLSAKPRKGALVVFQNAVWKVTALGNKDQVTITCLTHRRPDQNTGYKNLDNGRDTESNEGRLLTEYKNPTRLPKHLRDERDEFLSYAQDFGDVERPNVETAINGYYDSLLTRKKLDTIGVDSGEAFVSRKQAMQIKIRDDAGVALKGPTDAPEGARSESDTDLISDVKGIVNAEADNIRRVLRRDDIQIGFRGSLATGWKNFTKAESGKPKAFSTDAEWDVDAYLVVPADSRLTYDTVHTGAIYAIERRIHQQLSDLPGYRSGEAFRFYVRTSTEHQSVLDQGNPYPKGMMARIGRRKSELLRPSWYGYDRGSPAKQVYTTYPETPQNVEH